MKRISAILLAGVLATALPVQATVTVVDWRAIAESVARGKQLADQIKHQLAQLEELRQQIKAIKGSRNLGKIFAESVKNIPDEWADLYTNKSLSRDTAKVLSGKGYNQKTAEQQLVDYQNLIVKELEGTKARLRTIESLMDTINKTQDPKAIAELQSRIQSEQASIQHTQVQLDMLDRMFKMEEKIQHRKYGKQQACYAKQIRSGNYKACK